MEILKYLLFTFLFGFIFRIGKCSDTRLNQYLDEKLKEVKVNIAKSHIEPSQKVFVNNYNVSWSKSWTADWDMDSPVTINAFNKMLLVSRNGSVEISIDLSSSSRSSQIKRNMLIQDYARPIKFVRTIKWKTTLYLLICYNDGSCSLYTGNDVSNLIHRQNIKHRGFVMDASFFTKANRLYLVVANNLRLSSIPSLIYHWTGTYMDIVNEVTTTSAVSVTAFKYKQSIIIVFAQHVDIDPSIVSNVYEFKETGIETIQFLPTYKPISVRHYSYENYNFVLITNEAKASNVYWWDGTELLKWIDIPEIKGHYHVQTVYLQGGTYFIVVYNDIVELFKLYSTTNYVSLDITKLNDGRKIVDMQALVHDASVKIVITTLDQVGLYSVESWDLNLTNRSSHGNTKMVADSTQECLSNIIALLQTRMSAIDKFQSYWPHFDSSLANDSTDSITIKFPNVILDSGIVKNINLLTEDKILTSAELRKNFDDLNSKIEVLSKNVSSNILRRNAKNNLYGTINIDGDAFFEEMHIDKVFIKKLNNVDSDFRNLLSLKDDQRFEPSLRGENIIVRDLKVDSLCGIPNQYWATTDNKDSKILVSEQDNTREIFENKILVHSNITIPNLKVKKINRIDIDSLIDQLFILGGNQIITGNIVYNHLEVQNLTTKIYNGLSSILLMTRENDQDFYQFFMKTLKIDALHADFINDVALTEVAMKSRKNVIKGEVTINSIDITERFTIDPDAKISIIPPTKLYDNVRIIGNVTVKSFNFRSSGKLIMDNLEVQPNTIFENIWTKSTNQIIRNDISLNSGVTIDRLETEYLNGFTEKEFLYTTDDKISESFRNLHFENFHVNDVFHMKGKNINNFDVHQDSIRIYGDLRTKNLTINNFTTKKYNNIPVDLILNNTGSLEILKHIDFPVISAKRAIVRNLNFHSLNDRVVSSYLKMPFRRNNSFELGSIVTPEFHVKEIEIKRVNGTDISYLIDLKNATIEDIVSEIVIDDDLVLSDNLMVKIIGHYSTETYLKDIATQDILLPTGMQEKLTVQNITMNFLHGFKVNNLPSIIFSKKTAQKIPGHISFQKIHAKNMKVKYVNRKDTSKLNWIDEPLIFSKNLTFDDLFVDNDISTGNLNGYNIEEIYPSPLIIDSQKVLNLNVNGHISWKNRDNDSKSLSHLFEKAVQRDKPQTIQGNATFTTKLRALSYTGNVEGIDEIRTIVQDTVLKNSEKVSLGGQKTFKNYLTVNTLNTQNMIDMEMINRVNISQLNASIADKYQKNVVTGSIIFTEEVIVDNLVLNDTLHDTSQTDLVLSNQVLPDNIYIEDLVILGNVFLKTIDDVNFDEFVENRVTLSQNHVISSNVQFQGRVEVTGQAIVKSINRIRTSNLVINGLPTTQIISGAKTYSSDLTVNGNVHSPLVNNINIIDEYLNSVLNDENVTITGDIIFESNFGMPKNIIVSGLVNGVNVSKYLNKLSNQQNPSIYSLQEKEELIENTIKQKALVVKSLPKVFSYLEVENHLKIEAPSINKIDVVGFGSIAKFNMYGEQNGAFCGLPNTCSCPLQYIAELTEKNCRIWKWNDTSIVRNFHEPNGRFGLNVTTSTVSYNERCTRNETDLEFTTISWMINEKFERSDIANARYSDIKVKGFLKDAQVFTNDDQVYIVFAIYYDYTAKTHHTNSSIYNLNLENDSLTLRQEIPTDGASAIEVFKINSSTYIVIACDGDTTSSLIYKLHSNSTMFTFLRTFAGRSNYVKSLSRDKDHFVMLSDVNTNALNIYDYDHKFDNFYNYQSFFHDSRINGIQSFFTGDIGQSDAYVTVTTEDGQFYVYEYMFAGKFQTKIVHQMDDIRSMVPFYYEQRHYIIYGTKANTTIMRIVQQGLP